MASDFKSYKSGVYSSKICKSGPDTVNHAVLAVGYTLYHDLPYLVRHTRTVPPPSPTARGTPMPNRVGLTRVPWTHARSRRSTAITR